MNIYDYKVKDMNNNEVSLSDYKDKVLLIVNTATGCGFTPQYAGLEAMYKKYKDKGFEILDFPCNQFLGQAPGTAEQIHTFCTSKYNISFKQFAKIEVNGKNEEPLYTYLKEQQNLLDKSPRIEPQSLQYLGQILRNYMKANLLSLHSS